MKLISLFIFILVCFFALAQSTFPFYFSSGNFQPPDSWNQVDAVRMGTVANTNIIIAKPTTINNCYFRFYSATSGGAIYEPNGNMDVEVPLSTALGLEISGSGKAWYFSVTDTSDFYVFKTDGQGSPGNTRMAVIKVEDAIEEITAVSRFPINYVYPGKTVTITATVSGHMPAGQGLYLRYTTDNWNSSTITEMILSGSNQYSATIPSSVNMASTTVKYYVFTSGDSLNITHDEADLLTINLFNNNFENFSYIVECSDESLSSTYIKRVNTNKSRYNPGETINFEISFSQAFQNAQLAVSYLHLADTIEQTTISLSNDSVATWTWQPPSDDFKGYMAQITLVDQGTMLEISTIAVDVSSDWARFPRYGFLSHYGAIDSADIKTLLKRLNRYHINGLQFYDFHYKHHIPLAGTPQNLDSIWLDVANRTILLETVQRYIDQARIRNMNAMAYNLLYGAFLNTAVSDSVSETWWLYWDQQHQNPYTHDLPASWASDLVFINPANPDWQSYIFDKEGHLFQVLDFDGWHVDQVGDPPGTVYDYDGNIVTLEDTYNDFLFNAKATLNVDLVMNAVTQYGQQEIALAPVEFPYTESSNPFDDYADLKQIIDDNLAFSNNELHTVLAAYVNKGNSDTIGQINGPSVLFTDAVIFASGGAHLELGEHMLANEYFPNNNLEMSCSLADDLKGYYDFLTAYENVLRDSVTNANNTVTANGSHTLTSELTPGAIWQFAKQKQHKTIFHLINFTDQTGTDWRDNSNTRVEPVTIANLDLSLSIDKKIEKVWVASPDFVGGIPQVIPFSQYELSERVDLTLPTLKYWTMIVVELQDTMVNVAETENDQLEIKIWPNPVISSNSLHISFSQRIEGDLIIADVTGKEMLIEKLDNYYKSLIINRLSSGIYLLKIDGYDQFGKPVSHKRKVIISK